MDKGNLAIAGLVAGILGVVVGGWALMRASNAIDKANEALHGIRDVEAAALEPADIQKALREPITTMRADIEKIDAEVRADVQKLTEKVERSDILVDAKRHADENAERGNQQLVTQIKALQEEMAAGDQKTQAYYDELKADLEKKILDSNEKLKRMTTRWMESGAM